MTLVIIFDTFAARDLVEKVDQAVRGPRAVRSSFSRLAVQAVSAGFAAVSTARWTMSRALATPSRVEISRAIPTVGSAYSGVYSDRTGCPTVWV